MSAILGPEMGAPILWTPGKNAFFLQEKPLSVKFPFFGGGVLGGGGSADFIFMGARIFLNNIQIYTEIPRLKYTDRVHAKGVVLCERACLCLLSAF